MLRWKGGITNDKKYFSGKDAENILTTVKKKPFRKGDKRKGTKKSSNLEGCCYFSLIFIDVVSSLDYS